MRKYYFSLLSKSLLCFTHHLCHGVYLVSLIVFDVRLSRQKVNTKKASCLVFVPHSSSLTTMHWLRASCKYSSVTFCGVSCVNFSTCYLMRNSYRCLYHFLSLDSYLSLSLSLSLSPTQDSSEFSSCSVTRFSYDETICISVLCSWPFSIVLNRVCIHLYRSVTLSLLTGGKTVERSLHGDCL